MKILKAKYPCLGAITGAELLSGVQLADRIGHFHSVSMDISATTTGFHFFQYYPLVLLQLLSQLLPLLVPPLLLLLLPLPPPLLPLLYHSITITTIPSNVTFTINIIIIIIMTTTITTNGNLLLLPRYLLN